MFSDGFTKSITSCLIVCSGNYVHGEQNVILLKKEVENVLHFEQLLHNVASHTAISANPRRRKGNKEMVALRWRVWKKSYPISAQME